jgi:hypothetical protein
MDPSQADRLEYERQAIDVKIKSLEESIRVLRCRRNELAPISSLPVEVIQGIFSCSRLSPGTSSLLTGEKPDPLAWIRVAHVCHQWREIALNQPLFWSRVDVTDLTLAGATEILARAKTVPLYLEARIPHVHWNNSRFSAFEEQIQQHISHTCHLDISATYLRLHQILNGLVSPAPTLKCLSVSCEKLWPGKSALPETLFNRTAPRLSRLELCNCHISWESPLLKGLTYLEISSPLWDARPSLATWLDSLEEMPQLKTLILHSASPIALLSPSPPFDIDRTITLPSLTHLDISASPHDGTLALAHLNLPALAELSVATRSRKPGNEVPRILPYVALHAHGPQDTHPLQSVLIYTNNSRVDILAWTVPNINFDVRDSSIFHDAMLSARVMLSVTSSEWSADTHTRMIDVGMAALPLDSIVTLTVPEYTLLDEQVWRFHASRWRMLQCVGLGAVATCGFRRFLLDDNGENQCSLLPSLIKLVLVESDLLSPVSWILDIRAILIKRATQGIPMEVVDMRACAMADPAVTRNQLSELGVDVWRPTEENSEIQEPSFAMCYSQARGLLFPENSYSDLDVDEHDEEGNDLEIDEDDDDFDQE